MKYSIFDFDDTLVKTDAKVVVFGKRGRKELSSAEWATYKKQPSDRFDFLQFDSLINPRAIPKYLNKLKDVVKANNGKAIILTARSVVKPVAKFLRDAGIVGGVKIAAINSNNPDDKRIYIEKMINDRGATDIEFYDDSQKNISAVQTLIKKYPQVKFRIEHVQSIH